MPARKPKHYFWLMINRNQSIREYEDVEKEALDIFSNLIITNNYGDGVVSFTFDIYITPEVNYDLHRDGASSKVVVLRCNIDYSTFTAASHDDRVTLVCYAIKVMLTFWLQELPVPSDFDLVRLIADLNIYVLDRPSQMYPAELSQAIIKYFDTTLFGVSLIQYGGKSEDTILKYINEFEYFINNRLAGLTFGQSVRSFAFVLELYSSNFDMSYFLKKSANKKRFGHKHRYIAIVKQFEYEELLAMSLQQQYQKLKNAILEAIQDVEKMSKKPRDFDRLRFYDVMASILADYERQYVQ